MTFEVDDLVLREAGVTTQDEGKLGPQWEGPYVLIANHRPGSCSLKDSQGKELQHPCNA